MASIIITTNDSWRTKLSTLDKTHGGARYTLLLDVLHAITEHGAREPELVMRFGSELIDKFSSKLGDQVWAMRERVLLASFDCHDAGMQMKQLGLLKARFPKSLRVKKLSAMHFEATNKLDRAMDEYAAILIEDPVNQHAMKRRVCVERARGDLSAAARELTVYLKVFSADEPSWLELAEIYTQSAQFELAAFAIEELILIAPENYLYHLQYAEIQYTIGGRAEVDLARQYYAQSLELKPIGNLRAAMGLMLCLQQQNQRAGPKASLHAELHAFVTKKILAAYTSSTVTSSSSSSTSSSTASAAPSVSSISQQSVAEVITKLS